MLAGSEVRVTYEVRETLNEVAMVRNVRYELHEFSVDNVGLFFYVSAQSLIASFGDIWVGMPAAWSC